MQSFVFIWWLFAAIRTPIHFFSPSAAGLWEPAQQTRKQRFHDDSRRMQYLRAEIAVRARIELNYLQKNQFLYKKRRKKKYRRK